MAEASAPTTNQTSEKAQSERPIPTIYYEQLFGEDGGIVDQSEEMRYVYVSDALITSYGGTRGSGKSESLTFSGIKTMACGLECWSNYPIRAHYIDRHGHLRELEARPLYFKDLFNISADFKYGKIIIDEYQDWASAFASMSTQNRLLSGFWAQIRKNDLSFDYASKKTRWVDIRTREETDLEIMCRDAFHADGAGRQTEKGVKIFWDVKDMSGMWTGRDYETYGDIYTFELFTGIVRDAYDTKQRFDIFEALRGVKLDLEKDVITDKQEMVIDFERIEKQLEQIFNSTPRIRPSELWETLGIKKNEHKNQIRPMMRDMGVIEKFVNGSTFLVLDGFASYEPGRRPAKRELAPVG